MESSKVLLPKEVAEAIDWHEDTSKTRYQVMVVGFNDYYYCTPQARIMQTFAKEYPDLFAQAVLNGYEVEQTPEDKVREYYKEQRKLGPDDIDDYAADAIIATLNFLNIKIEGVNDHENN